jgi:hypothetical protein
MGKRHRERRASKTLLCEWKLLYEYDRVNLSKIRLRMGQPCQRGRGGNALYRSEHESTFIPCNEKSQKLRVRLIGVKVFIFILASIMGRRSAWPLLVACAISSVTSLSHSGVVYLQLFVTSIAESSQRVLHGMEAWPDPMSAPQFSKLRS